jgi:NAD(P)-dependent dehydrogenase (short-subunit alcohol dehydrogenase family)
VPSGIGLGIATALSQAGVKVMLCDIEDAALLKAVADLKLTNADVDGVRADCRSKPSFRPQPTLQSPAMVRSTYW